MQALWGEPLMKRSANFNRPTFKVMLYSSSVYMHMVAHMPLQTDHSIGVIPQRKIPMLE